MSSQPYVSIIIPCYNEAENLRHGVLGEVWSYLEKATFPWELIISDDGSTDDSVLLVREFITDKAGARLLPNPHGGKPAAIMHGIDAARGEFILFTDMDQSTPLAEIEALLPYFDSCNVIIGSRRDRKNFPLYRRIGSTLFRWIRKALILPKINDTQCGFKAIRTELARRLFPKLEFCRNQTQARGWTVTSFDVELLHLAERNGQTIREVQVNWEDRDQSTGKQKSYLRESWGMLKQVLRIKWNDLSGKYNSK